MPTLFNFRGYTSPDPLDKAPKFTKFILLISVNFILTIGLLYLITTYKIVSFNGFNLGGHQFPPLATEILEVVINCLIFSPLIMLSRKSSSLISFLIVFLPYFLMDLFFESHYRCCGNDPTRAPWTYPDPSIVSSIKIPTLKFFVTISSDALLFGVFGLFIARLLASVLYKNKPYPVQPTKEQYNNLFRKEWSDEEIKKPSRDFAFYILRILGFIYLAYLLILISGLTGSAAFPQQLKDLIDMTYENPALAINTYFKITLMITLTFLAAYNKSLRFYSCCGLLAGHFISTAYSLIFHYCKSLNATHADFLLTSAIADGLMIIVFLWIMIKYKKDADVFSPENDFPINFSVPMTLLQYLYKFLGILFSAITIIIICLRLFTDGNSGLSAVFGSPDPMIGNTVTLYSTLALISFILVKRERLRQHFFNPLIVPFIFGGVTAVLWVIIGNIFSTVLICTRSGALVQVDWYFVLHAVFSFIIVALVTGLRKMYYKVDYAFNTLSPSAAINAIALTNAFFENDDKKSSAIVHSIDQYAGGIRGRKRGLLNLPFALFENVLNFIYGLRPAFSSMSRDEQRYFLRKYFLRNEPERNSAFIPPLAEFAYQIGLSLNSIIMFANYSELNVRNGIGYVPVDARDRTQGDCAKYDPPYNKIADLPKDHLDANNFAPPADNCIDGPLIAPRVTTPVKEENIPDEVDYIVIGSGAGGATAAYRLAQSHSDPSQILVIERGYRYQPLQDFNDSEIQMMKKIYKEGGLQQTKKFTMTVLQGECVGGTTVANNAVCFQIPGRIKQRWENEYGLNLADIADEYKTIEQELDIKPLGSKGVNTIVRDKFTDAVSKYNALLPAEDKLLTEYPVKVNHRNNMGDGNWNLGNKRMRKRSMLETYIPWSEARGVKVISNMTAVRFTTSGTGRKAEYVILRTDSGALRKVKVRKAVIVAGGVIASSHFLKRSEIKNKTIGQRVSCNFALPLTFDFNDEIKAYDGDQITLAAIDPHLRSAFETYFNPPAAFALAGIPFFFERRNSVMNRYKHLVNFGSLLGSESNGSIQEKADLLNGLAFSWELGTQDIINIKYAINTLIQLGMHAGSTRVVLPTKPGIELPLTTSNVDEFTKSFNDFPLRMKDVFIATAHPQGGNLMAGNNSQFKSQRVVNEDFRVEGFDNVFVADASLFPTSITINPQWTIMAMSSMAAKSVLKICS